MAFSVPQNVTDFFTKYPNAADVYVDEDYSNSYLNHFYNKALSDAKQNGKRLYSVKANGGFQRQYPTKFLYILTYDTNDGAPNGGYDIADALVGAEAASVAAQTTTAIASAFDAALQAAAVLANPTEVTETSAGVFEIRVVTSVDELVIGVLDDNAANYYGTQEFL